jgi:hypothetical protein
MVGGALRRAPPGTPRMCRRAGRTRRACAVGDGEPAHQVPLAVELHDAQRRVPRPVGLPARHGEDRQGAHAETGPGECDEHAVDRLEPARGSGCRRHGSAHPSRGRLVPQRLARRQALPQQLRASSRSQRREESQCGAEHVGAVPRAAQRVPQGVVDRAPLDVGPLAGAPGEQVVAHPVAVYAGCHHLPQMSMSH